MSSVAFAVAKWSWWLARPSTLLLLVLIVGLVLTVRGRARLGSALSALALTGLVLTSLAPITVWLAAPLENRYPRPTDLSDTKGIVVLGGALEPHVTAARGTVSLNDGAERMTTFVALARRLPDARLVFTGGSSSIVGDVPTEAEIARELFASLGLNDRVVYEDRSRDTYENALFTKRLVNPAAGDRWLLVTSALHMPRALGSFQAVGWNVTPYPVDYLTSGDVRMKVPPDIVGNLAELDRTVGEWLSLLAFRVLGRTSRLLPIME